MSMRFQNCLVVSAAVHLSMIGPALFPANLPGPFHREVRLPDKLVVEYLIMKEPRDEAKKAEEAVIIEATRASAASLKAEPGRPKIRGGPPVAAEKRPAARPQAVPAKQVAPRTVNTGRSTIKRVDAAGEIPVGDIIKKQARLRSTKEFVSYFSLIRENIRRELKIKYKNYHGEGDVHVVFVLDADGRLAGIETEASGALPDNKLADIAAASVRKASPFPHFPKSFPLRQMYFNLIVSFKRQ